MHSRFELESMLENAVLVFAFRRRVLCVLNAFTSCGTIFLSLSLYSLLHTHTHCMYVTVVRVCVHLRVSFVYPFTLQWLYTRRVCVFLRLFIEQILSNVMHSVYKWQTLTFVLIEPAKKKTFSLRIYILTGLRIRPSQTNAKCISNTDTTTISVDWKCIFSFIEDKSE